MSGPSVNAWKAPRADELQAAHDAARDFEQAWRSGQEPRIESFLPFSRGQRRRTTLFALLEVEWELRASAGDTLDPAEYARRFPEAQSWIEAQLPRALTGVAADQTCMCRIGRYHVLQEIGRGGMSVVYRVFDPELNRLAAMKVILGGHLASEEDLRRFERETQLLAQLDHPGIVAAYETGEWAGNRYLTMPLIDGPNLAEYLGRQPIPWRRAVDIVQQLAVALDYAHRRGVIHRDLSPRNVLLERDRVRATDFGLAKLLPAQQGSGSSGRRSHLTLTGQVLGTPDYMSPEQAGGRTDLIGPATDIHGLGAILYELLTRRRPFESDNVWTTLERVRTADPLPPHEVQRRVPRDLSAVCMKCLEKEPTQRYRTAAELARELERVAHGEPVRARTVSRWERAWRWCRRNPRSSTLAAMVVSLLATLSAGSIFATFKFRRDERVAREAQAEAEAAEHRRRRELFRVYLSEATVVDAAHSAGTRAHAASALRSALAATPWAELSAQQRRDAIDAAIPWLAQASLEVKRRIPTALPPRRNDLRLLDVDSDLAWCAVSNGRVGTQLVDVDGRVGKSYSAPPDRFDGAPATRILSDDGRWLAEVGWVISQSSAMRVRVWERSTGKVALSKTVEEVGVLPIFHPNGRDLLHLDRNRVQIHNLESKALVAESPARFRACKLALSDDGQLLAIASLQFPIEVVDSRDWTPCATFPQLPRATSVAWQPRSHAAVFGFEDGRIARIALEPAPRIEFLDTAGRGAIDQLAISADASLVASCDANRRMEVHALATGDRLTRATGCPIRFGRDSRSLAMIDGSDVVIAELTLSTVYRQVEIAGDCAQFSPDERWLAISGPRGVRLLRTADLQPVADLGLDASGPIAFRPDGRAFATFGCFSHLREWTCDLGDSAGQIGPPAAMPLLRAEPLSLAPQHAGRHCAFSADGQRLFVGDYRHSALLMYDQGSRRPTKFADVLAPTLVVPHPSGQWVAVGDCVAQEVSVWEIESGKRCFRAPAALAAAFTGDGRWLVARNPNEICVFDVGSWALVRSIALPAARISPAMPLAVQPHGLLVAAEDRWDQIKLFHLGTGEHVATLWDRNAGTVASLSFSADGLLLASCRRNRLATWNLGSLRRELQLLGLYADGLPAESSEQSGPNRSLPTWRVDRGDLPPASQWHQKWVAMGRAEASEGHFPDAIDDLNKAASQVEPDDASALAKVLVERGSYHEQNGSLALAIEDWQRALRLTPGEQTALQRLACLYLLGPPPFRDCGQASAVAARIDPGSSDPVAAVLRAAAAVCAGGNDPAQFEMLESASGRGAAFSQALASSVLADAALDRDDLAGARVYAARVDAVLDDPSLQAHQESLLRRWAARFRERLLSQVN